MDGAANARPFPFFKLPAEIRNKIYCLLVITGQNLIIQDMHLDEFEKSQQNGTYQCRSTYLPTDHVCDCPEGYHPRTAEPCSFKDPWTRPLKTTYMLSAPNSNDDMTTVMLLNKQSREEVAFIFYSRNTFFFMTMSSLTPFMKDRTAGSRKYIQRLHLLLTVDDGNWDAVFAEYGRPATWNTAFSTLLALPHVNIKRLLIHVDDRKAKLLTDGIKLRSRSMLWLHKLSKVENLEMLGVEYCFRYRNHREQSNTEEELWRFLAPRMLNREADDHSPDALQERRIWGGSDAFLSCLTYTIVKKLETPIQTRTANPITSAMQRPCGSHFLGNVIGDQNTDFARN